MTSQAEDKFNNATAYDRYIGRWSREVAKEFINWLDAPPEQFWLDVGAGTGILTDVILRQARPARVIGIDTSQSYLELAQERIKDPRAQFYLGDANDLNLSDTDFDVSVAGLVINFVPSPQRAVNNMARLVKAGGVVAAYVWDYTGKMEFMRHFWDAAITVDPSAIEFDARRRFTICNPDNLKSLFESEGLKAVDVVPIDIQTVFKDFDDYWQPFLAEQGSVSRYLRSINQETRNAIRDQLQKQLPIEEDGTIHLAARTWAVKGLT